MEWVVKPKARSGWGEEETIEVGRLERRVIGPTVEEIGLTLQRVRICLLTSRAWSCRPRWKS
jgi:hypothetical protein